MPFGAGQDHCFLSLLKRPPETWVLILGLSPTSCMTSGKALPSWGSDFPGRPRGPRVRDVHGARRAPVSRTDSRFQTGCLKFMAINTSLIITSLHFPWGLK